MSQAETSSLADKGAEQKHVVVYTDGACDPNPGGPGGYGVVLVYRNRPKDLSGGFRSTTNNRMEVYAAIVGLEALKTVCRVTLYSDSEYLVSTMTRGWAERWKQNNWWRNRNEKAVNADLWERLLALCQLHQVEFVWVRGHADNPGNERCDQLALAALRKSNLPADEGYEQRPDDESATGKITHEGQLCRKCSTPVIKQIPRKRASGTRTSYFEYYLYCPKCHTMYMVEEARRPIEEQLPPALF